MQNNYLSSDVSEKIKGEFDPVFEKFYNTGTVNIDDADYGIKDLYVKTMEDDKNYLTMVGEKKIYLLHFQYQENKSQP